MKNLPALLCRGLAVMCFLDAGALPAQESGSGIDLRATISSEAVFSRELTHAPRFGAPVTAGLRAVFYPEWKMGARWALSGVVQVNSLPYFYKDFSTGENGARVHVLQANLGYYRVWKDASLVIRAGQLQSAFGNFLLHYDDAANPLFGTPTQYGYDFGGVTTLGLAGIEILAARGKWDARAQLTNSSPANPRSLFDKDQYANGTAGMGYTFRQGLRAGISAYAGPYLDRHYPDYFDGEARAGNLPATAVGADAEWARGHLNVTGEWQYFSLPFPGIPPVRQTAAYTDAKLVLHPRWYVAARAGFRHAGVDAGEETYEFTAGFRPGASLLIKTGFLVERSRDGELARTFGIQFITTIHPFSVAWK